MKTYIPVVLGLLVLSSCSSSKIKGLKTYSFPGGVHQEGPITYEQTPTAGGPHNPIWQNCGVYTAPLYGQYVAHSLEHGAVSVTYLPSLSAGELQALNTLVAGHAYTLLWPEPEQSSPIVISAWGAQLAVEKADDDRLAIFLKTYEGAKTAPEPGAPCSGGLSTTR